MPRKGYMWVQGKPSPESPKEPEKQAIIAACEAVISNPLKPRYLPEITPKETNYPIDISGDYRGGRYRFMVRCRSGFPHNTGYEFDEPFARIDRMGPDRFNIQRMHDSGEWFLVHEAKTLAEALDLVATDEILQPPI
ncbi:DUF3024 domain-containing protein [Rhodopila globiformis]|nr:hypothetical protein [Rhodopila globiformis]